MAERNVTFLIIARDFASRTLKNVGDSTDRTAQKLRNLNTLGLGPLGTAAAALGPVLLPVMAGAVVGAVGLGTAFLGAGAAVGVFGAVTKSVFGEVHEASKKSEDLRKKISLLTRERMVAAAAGNTSAAATYEKARIKATYEYRARLQELPGPMRAAVMGMDAMRTSWEGFVESNRTPVLGLLARGMTLLAVVLPHLQPLFNVAASAASGLMLTFERFVSNGSLDRMISYLAARAGPALKGFGHILMNLGYGMGQLLAPFANASDGIVGGLDRMTRSFADWASTSGRSGMEKILTFAREQGPGAASALWELAKSIGTIARAAAPLAPVSAAIARSLGLIINALPQPVLTALVAGFIAWNVGLQGVRVGLLLASGASKLAAAGVWLMNSALLASPITWVVIGLVALAAGLIYAYKHSETFRRIVQGALAGAVAGGKALLGFFRGLPAFFSGVWGLVTGTFTSATNWVALKVIALGGWFQALPGRIMRGIAALPGLWWRFWSSVWERAAYLLGYGIGLLIRGAIRLPGLIRRAIFGTIAAVATTIVATWNGAKARTVAGVNAVVGFARTLPGRARAAIASVIGLVGTTLSSTWQGAKSRTISGINSTISFFRTLPGRARSAISGLPGQIRSVFAGAGGWLVSAGGDIIRGLVRGIGNMVGAAVGEARRIASSIVSGVRAGLGIGSPSKVMADQVGRWIPPGVLAGIHAAAPGLLAGMGGVMDDLVGAATRPVIGRALLAAEGSYSGGGGRPAMAQAESGGEMLQPIVLVVDGVQLQRVLLKLKRTNGGRALGLG